MAETNVEKLIRALVAPFQPLEDTLQQLLTERTVETAVGVQLDALGSLVGVGRGGLDDDTYRRYIRAQITINKSDGLIEEMLTVADLLVFDDDAAYHLERGGVASFMLTVEGIVLDWDLAEVLIAALRKAVSAGVRPTLAWDTDPAADMFTFAAFGGGDPAVGEGFVEFDGSGGGALGAVLE